MKLTSAKTKARKGGLVNPTQVGDFPDFLQIFGRKRGLSLGENNTVQQIARVANFIAQNSRQPAAFSLFRSFRSIAVQRNASRFTMSMFYGAADDDSGDDQFTLQRGASFSREHDHEGESSGDLSPYKTKFDKIFQATAIRSH